MSSDNFIERIENIKNYKRSTNFDMSDINEFSFVPKSNDQLMADDLLSTHPLMGTNLILGQDEPLFNKKLNYKIRTEKTSNIFLVNSGDRNLYYESLLCFSIRFNPSGDHYKSIPVYFNNPTIPQTALERKYGNTGKSNTKGWKDEMGNSYPAFDSSKPSGDIVSYDSIKEKATYGAYISYKLENVISFKVVNAIIPAVVKHGINTIISKYWYLRLSEINSNIHSSNHSKVDINDFLIPSSNTANDLKDYWVPTSKSYKIFDPPRNGFNSIKIQIIPDIFSSSDITNLNNRLISPEFTIFEPLPFPEIMETLWFKDTITLSKIEIDPPYAILHTSAFSQGYNHGRWHEGTKIRIHNLLSNIDFYKTKTINNFNSTNRSELDELLVKICNIFQDKETSIFFTALGGLNKPESMYDFIKPKLSISKLGDIVDIFREGGNLIDKNLPIGNRIIVFLPLKNKTKQDFFDLDNLEDKNNHNLHKTIGSEKILIPFVNKDWDYMASLFFDSDLGDQTKLIFPNGIYFSNTGGSEWIGKGPIILNSSVQIILTLRVETLTPKIIYDDNDENGNEEERNQINK